MSLKYSFMGLVIGIVWVTVKLSLFECLVCPGFKRDRSRGQNHYVSKWCSCTQKVDKSYLNPLPFNCIESWFIILIQYDSFFFKLSDNFAGHNPTGNASLILGCGSTSIANKCE